MKKIAFLFPGQGSQYVGMGKSLCQNHSLAKQTYIEANDVLGFDLQKLCFEGSLEELSKTENTQPALLTASVAFFRVFMKEIGIEPAALAGHSLGEISALTCSGAIQFSDALRIVRQRGRFMQEAVPVGLGGMSSVIGIKKNIIEEVCQKYTTDGQIVAVSNFNSPEQIVISGHINAVNQAGEDLKAKGGRIIPLMVSAPFHSPLMQPAADKLKEELLKYNYSNLKYPVISNVTAEPYPGHEKIIEYLTMQIVKPVNWSDSMEYIRNVGIEAAVELGPKTVLRNLIAQNVKSITAFSYDDEKDSDKLKSTVFKDKPEAGTQKKFKHTVVLKCIAIAICTRNYNWNNDEYQKGVVEPYRRVVQLQSKLEAEGRQPTYEEMQEALNMLISVFETKRTPLDEQSERFRQIFDETGTWELFKNFKIPV